MPRRTRIILIVWLASLGLLIQLCVPDIAMADLGHGDADLCLGHHVSGIPSKPPQPGHPPPCPFCLAQAALALGPVPGPILFAPRPVALDPAWPAGIVPALLFLTQARSRAPPPQAPRACSSSLSPKKR